MSATLEACLASWSAARQITGDGEAIVSNAASKVGELTRLGMRADAVMLHGLEMGRTSKQAGERHYWSRVAGYAAAIVAEEGAERRERLRVVR